MKKHHTHIQIIAVVLLAALVLGMPAMLPPDTQTINDKVLRLHVIANSDSPEDQDLKRAVRDRIIAEVSADFKSAHDIEETKRVAASKLGVIEAAAADEIKRAGKGYPVRAELAKFAFPVKKYGDFVFPPGNYEALRVVIGDGRGANWWCVLFPPLCFVDVTHATTAQAEAELGKVLTEEEIAQLKKTGKPEQVSPVVIRFKVVEWIKGISAQLAGAKAAR